MSTIQHILRLLRYVFLQSLFCRTCSSEGRFSSKNILLFSSLTSVRISPFDRVNVFFSKKSEYISRIGKGESNTGILNPPSASVYLYNYGRTIINPLFSTESANFAHQSHKNFIALTRTITDFLMVNYRFQASEFKLEPHAPQNTLKTFMDTTTTPNLVLISGVHSLVSITSNKESFRTSPLSTTTTKVPKYPARSVVMFFPDLPKLRLAFK